ncbi:hypothetical protein BIV60_08310 [Bacillus sp. MUM 116]|uniref:hypothetical protein n=1 Tax=Bacillus sp. MUM 116 TaxID=1678002 RepID=UPI0008F5C80E|nr:hypothetical protein [Bacillus sp. MUM 116]OIK15744.1 hypothetical protein BIV60_08310 [Bacillus sp. MUM 116]
MPRKAAQNDETTDEESNVVFLNEEKEDESADLSRMLAAVMNYLTNDDLEELDIEYLLDSTVGLRDWWSRYRESNKKIIEEEIKKSLGDLSLKDLEKIREQIKEIQE